MRRRATLLLVVAVAAACSAGSPPPSATSGEVVVFAAASLTEAFRAVGADFREANGGAFPSFNFAGTPTLLGQLRQGAPADVFASADEPNMRKAEESGLLAGPARTFARNRLEIVVASGNPKHVAGLADLGRPDVLYVAAAPDVPAGRFSAQVLATAGVKANPRSLESDVRAVLSKVELGEADAGIVYVTDIRAAGPRAAGVVIPDNQNLATSYLVAVLRESAHTGAGRAFVDFLLGPRGQADLERLGFSPP